MNFILGQERDLIANERPSYIARKMEEFGRITETFPITKKQLIPAEEGDEERLENFDEEVASSLTSVDKYGISLESALRLISTYPEASEILDNAFAEAELSIENYKNDNSFATKEQRDYFAAAERAFNMLKNIKEFAETQEILKQYEADQEAFNNLVKEDLEKPEENIEQYLIDTDNFNDSAEEKIIDTSDHVEFAQLANEDFDAVTTEQVEILGLDNSEVQI